MSWLLSGKIGYALAWCTSLLCSHLLFLMVNSIVFAAVPNMDETIYFSYYIPIVSNLIKLISVLVIYFLVFKKLALAKAMPYFYILATWGVFAQVSSTKTAMNEANLSEFVSASSTVNLVLCWVIVLLVLRYSAKRQLHKQNDFIL